MSAGSSTNRLCSTARRPLLQLAVAAAMGIVADRLSGGWFVEHGLYLWWSTTFGCLLISLMLHGRREGRWATALLLLATVGLGASWHHLRWHYFEQDHLARFANEVPRPVCLQVVALDRLKYSPAPPSNPLRALPVGPRSEIRVRVTRVRDGREWRDVAGTCRLRVNGELTEVMAGDELLVYGLMGRRSPALNPGEYDWSLAERGAGRHCELSCAGVCDGNASRCEWGCWPLVAQVWPALRATACQLRAACAK